MCFLLVMSSLSLSECPALTMLDMLTSQSQSVVDLSQDNASIIMNPKGEMKGSAITGLVAKEYICKPT